MPTRGSTDRESIDRPSAAAEEPSHPELRTGRGRAIRDECIGNRVDDGLVGGIILGIARVTSRVAGSLSTGRTEQALGLCIRANWGTMEATVSAILAVGLNGKPYYIHWGWFQISAANLAVIALMLIVFTLAIVLPFPKERR